LVCILLEMVHQETLMVIIGLRGRMDDVPKCIRVHRLGTAEKLKAP